MDRQVKIRVDLEKTGSLGLEKEAAAAKQAEQAIDSLKAKAGVAQPAAVGGEAAWAERFRAARGGAMGARGAVPPPFMPEMPPATTPGMVDFERGLSEGRRMRAEAARRPPPIPGTGAGIGRTRAIMGAGMALGGMALSVAGPEVGALAGSAMSGAMGGAMIGSALPGVGTAVGAVIGGAVGVLTTAMTKVGESFEGAAAKAEKFNQQMKSFGDIIMAAEASIAAVRRGETPGAGGMGVLPGGVSGRILTAPMEARPGIISAERRAMEARGPAGIEELRSFAPMMRADEAAAAEAALRRRHEAAVGFLRAGEARGISGITRDEDVPRGAAGGATTAIDTITSSLLERSPMVAATERSAAAAEALLAAFASAFPEIRESLIALGAPGVGPA